MKNMVSAFFLNQIHKLSKLFSPLMSEKEVFYFQCHVRKSLLPLGEGRKKH